MTRAQSPLSYTGRIPARQDLNGEIERPISGTATLVAGVATVAVRPIREGAVVVLTKGSPNTSASLGFPYLSSQTPGVGFAIEALDETATLETADVSDVSWMIFNP